MVSHHTNEKLILLPIDPFTRDTLDRLEATYCPKLDQVNVLNCLSALHGKGGACQKAYLDVLPQLIEEGTRFVLIVGDKVVGKGNTSKEAETDATARIKPGEMPQLIEVDPIDLYRWETYYQMKIQTSRFDGP